MCIIDYDPASFYTIKTVTASKPHTCDECQRTIQPLETYRRTFAVWDGIPSIFKTCSHCCVGQDWLRKNCGGFMHAELLSEIAEHADEYPDLRFGMRRLQVGIERRWAGWSGGLLPVQPAPRDIHV